MYSYKARVYSPTLGRFMQTDPIGYADGLNWYGYVKSDPANATDPTGTDDCLEACKAGGGSPSDIYVPGRRSNFWFNYGLVFGGTHGPDFGTIAQLTIAMQVDQAVLAVAGIDAAAAPVSQNGRSKKCGGSGFASGAYAGGSAEAGIIAAGAATQGQLSLIGFGQRAALLKTTGSFVGGPGYGFSSPSTGRGGVVAGGTIGVGGGLTFSNARRASDLAGTARTLSINVGPISLSGSPGGNGIFTLSGGPSLGASFAVSMYDTNTEILIGDGC